MTSIRRTFFTIGWIFTFTFVQLFIHAIQAYAQTSAPASIQKIECLTDTSLTCHLAIASSDLPDSLTEGQVIVQENEVKRTVISSEIKPGSVNFAAVLNINDLLRNATWVREVSSAIRAYPVRFASPAPTDQDKLTLFATRPTGSILKQPVLWQESGGYGNLANEVQRILESGRLDSPSRIPAFTLLLEAVTNFGQVSSGSAQINHLLLVTDGNNLGSYDQREEIVNLARDMNVRIHIFMLWVDTSVATEDLNLNRLATETGGEYLRIRNLNQAGSTTQQMNPIWDAMDQTRNRAFITYEMGNAQPTSLAVEIQTANGKTILARSDNIPAIGLQPPTVVVEASRSIDRTLESNQDTATLPAETLPFQINYVDGHPRPLDAGACFVNGVEVYKINAGEPLQCVLNPEHLIAGDNKVEVIVTDLLGSVGKAESILHVNLSQPMQSAPAEPTPLPTVPPTSEPTPTTLPTETAVPISEPASEPTSMQPVQVSFLGAVNGQIELTRTSDFYDAPVSAFLPKSWQISVDLSTLVQSGVKIQCVEYQIEQKTVTKACESPFAANLDIETWGADQYKVDAIVYDASNNQVALASVLLNLTLHMPMSASTPVFIQWAPWLIGLLSLGLLVYRRLRKREEDGFTLSGIDTKQEENDTRNRNTEDDSTAHVNRAPVRARLVLQPGNDVLPAVIYLRARTAGLWGLARSEWRLGRRANPLKCDPDCVIDDPRRQISRHQVTILEENGRFSIRDEGGSSGTTLNGRQLPVQQLAPLSHGDTIKFDVVSYGFQIEDNPIPYQSPVVESEQNVPFNPVSRNGYFGQQVTPKGDSRDHEDVTERVNHWNS